MTSEEKPCVNVFQHRDTVLVFTKNVIGLPVVDELFKLDLLTFYLRGYGDGFRDVLDTLLETERPDFVVSS